MAKIGRRMKKLTMTVGFPGRIGRGSAGSGSRAGGFTTSAGPTASAGRDLWSPSASRRVSDGRLGLDREARADHLQPLDDHRDAGVEALGDDPQPLVGLARDDPPDGHLALLVDDVDDRARVGLDDRRGGDDDGVLEPVDDHPDLDVLARAGACRRGWGSAALTRKVEVVSSTVLSMKKHRPS